MKFIAFFQTSDFIPQTTDNREQTGLATFVHKKTMSLNPHYLGHKKIAKNIIFVYAKIRPNIQQSGNLFEQKKEVFHYKGLAMEDIGKVFAYLNSVSFNYSIASPPKMDKTIFSSRKN